MRSVCVEHAAQRRLFVGNQASVQSDAHNGANHRVDTEHSQPCFCKTAQLGVRSQSDPFWAHIEQSSSPHGQRMCCSHMVPVGTTGSWSHLVWGEYVAQNLAVSALWTGADATTGTT